MAARLNLTLGAVAAAQLAAGLAMQFAVLIVLGAGPDTDAYVAAQTVPLLLFGIFALPLQNIWLPQLAVLATDLSAWRQAQGLAQGQVLLLVGGMAVLLAASAPWWVGWMFAGWSHAQTRLTVQLTQILLLASFFNGQAALLTTALRAREQFLAPEAVLLLMALLGVAATFLALERFGVLGAAWVSAARSALGVAVLHGLARWPPVRVRAAALDAVSWQRVRPLLAGSSLYKCEPLVDRYWGAQASAGGLTILSLSQTGMGAIAQVFERALCMPLTPRLAQMAAAGNHAGMRALVRRCQWRVALLVGLCLLALLLLYPVWNDLMAWAFKLPQALSAQMWLVCVALLGFVHVAASGSMPMAAFYALGDTRTPVRLSMASFVVGIALKAGGFMWLGLTGLALATSAYYLGNLLLVTLFLERRLNHASPAPG